MREQFFFIPADVTINADGTILTADLDKVYNLDNRIERWLMSFTGMGMPPIRYITQRGPRQHGSTILDFRLQERLIQLVHRRNVCSRQEYWDARRDLLDHLRPNRVDLFNAGRLRIITPDGNTFDIKATIEQGPVFRARNPKQWDEWAITETLRLLCPNPTFFDPATETIIWTIIQRSGWAFGTPTRNYNLVFPDTALFGSDVLVGSATVTYTTGNWFAYPTIVIRGPINQPQLRNETLDILIKLEYEVAENEEITIITEYGNKSVTSSINGNLIGTVSDDSELNFYLAPADIAPGGVNILSASGAGGDAAKTQITLTYNNRFIGI